MKHLHEKLMLLGYRQRDANVFIGECLLRDGGRWNRSPYFLTIMQQNDVWKLHINISAPITLMEREVVITAAGEVFYYAWQFLKLVTHQQIDTMISDLLTRYPDGNPHRIE